MDKLKILVVPSDRAGVSYYRSTKPHIFLQNMYKNEIHIDIDYEPQLNNDEWLKQYDIIHYHRTLGSYELMPELLDRLDSLGIVTVMDIDDYWTPDRNHPAYKIIKNKKLDEKILNNIKIARNIITTTDIFAKEISKYNKNVSVIPNGIDPTEKQFIPNLTKSDRIRIGWLGGSSHLKDLELLRGLVSKLKSDNLLSKVQFVLCGFDLRGVITAYDEHGREYNRKITPTESVWYKYEQIFTDNYKNISPEYKEHLLEFTNSEYHNVDNESYRRVWTKPITSYANNYNLFDISLAPLVDNTFNKMKSQLKVIESGFHKKPIIAQDFGPYQIDLINAYEKPKSKKDLPTINHSGNALLVNNNHKEWYSHIKRLIQNPELIEELGLNLFNTVSSKYSLEVLSENRKNLYFNLVEQNKK